MADDKGIVFLIGAGPGDPGLLTIRAAEAISRADALVYDRLAHPAILDHAHPQTERIYVGKLPDRHTLKQEEINQLLVDKASEGKTVARIKGGDPFVFGRGGEEAEALANAGIEFEVIPGITSAIAVPAYAGIPVTHREHTSVLGIITGHEDPLKETSALRWEHLAKGLDTLVFLMGVKNLPEIVSRLRQHGRPESLPVAVIEWGTRPEQRVVTASLGTVVVEVEKAGLNSPSVIIVGDVVRLREKLAWFDRRPLFGKRIVVTRSREQASELSSRLAELGAMVIEFPVIKCRALEDTSELDIAIDNLESYDWIVFTSVNGVNFFINRLMELGSDVRAMTGIKIGVLGEATRRAIQERSLRVDFTPTRFVGEAFVEEFPEPGEGLRILIPRAAEAREIIPDQLRKRGADVEVVACYETVIGDANNVDLPKLLQAGAVDMVTFTSSSTVTNFSKLIAPDGKFHLPPEIQIASIGPITSKTVKELGMDVDVEAAEHTIPGLVQAILNLGN